MTSCSVLSGVLHLHSVMGFQFAGQLAAFASNSQHCALGMHGWESSWCLHLCFICFGWAGVLLFLTLSMSCLNISIIFSVCFSCAICNAFAISVIAHEASAASSAAQAPAFAAAVVIINLAIPKSMNLMVDLVMDLCCSMHFAYSLTVNGLK